jgi:hypothetical protein
MRCEKCGSEVSEGWSFCPRCGSKIGKARERDMFSDVFERMEHEMKEMSRAFDSNFEVLDLSPFFRRQARGSGFTVNITRSGDGKPKVDIRTFGDVNRKEVENEVSRLGFRDRISKALKPGEGAREAKPVSSRLGNAKTTEDPETSVRNIGGRIITEVKLPDVKRAEDIEVKQLDNSIEVRAIAGDKAYFKILTKPPQTRVVRQEFSGGVLTIEIN